MRKRRLIRGLALLALLGAAYTGYWFWLARTFEQQLALWVDQQRAMGYGISYSSSEPHGYPLPVRIALTDVSVQRGASDPPWFFDAASIELSIPPWNPLSLRITDGRNEGQSRLNWTAAGRNLQLSFDDFDTTIKLAPESVPPKITVAARSIDYAENGVSVFNTYLLSGNVKLFDTKTAAETSAEFSFNAYQISLSVQGGGAGTSKEIYSPLLAGRIVGPMPNRPFPEALAEWSGQGGYLDLTSISANASPPRIDASATLALDPRLQPIGAGTVTLRDYIRGVDWVVEKGLMTKVEGVATKMWLSARAEDDNGSLKVTLPITIQDGFVSLGPAKVAQLPPIRWQ